MTRLSRRQLLRGCAAGVVGLAGCSSRSGIPAPDCREDELIREAEVDLARSDSWPTYQYDPANTGHNPDASGPKDDVQLAWRHPACTETDSGAVLHEGRASAGGLVLDGQTGKRVGGEWDAHAGTPAFADGRLYVGAHDLLARDATTGDLDWTFETESESGGLGTPVVVDGTVYVPGNIGDASLYAVDATEGEEAWRFEPDSEVRSPPAVADGTVFVVDDETTAYAVDAATGDELWRRSPEVDVARSTPVVADGRLYLGSLDGDVLALDVDDGSDVWRRDVGTGPAGPAAVANDTVFVPGTGGVFRAISASDGSDEWDRSVDSGGFGAPVVADGVAYVGAGRTVHAFDASNGDERWQFQTREVLFGDYVNGGVNDGLAVVDDLLYVATATGDLYALVQW